MTTMGRRAVWGFLAFIALAFHVPDQAFAHEGHDHSAIKLARAVGTSGSILMEVAFECAHFQGDCAKVHIVRPPASQERLWLSGVGVSPAKALKGELVKDGILRLDPGTFVFVKVVYVNDTDKEVRFRAIPHFTEPRELQELALLNCMCLGEPYRVAPGKAWFRVLRLGVARDMPPGARLRVTHILTSEAL